MIKLYENSTDSNTVENYNEDVKSILKATTDVDYDSMKDHLSNKDLSGIKDDTDKISSNLDSISQRIGNKNRVVNQSIIARARKSVLQFPVYITESNRVAVAHTISKMFERVYADYVQTALASNPIINEEEANGLLFLKQFHSNIKESVDTLVNSFYEPIDEFDEMMQNSISNVIPLSEHCDMVFKLVPTENPDLIAENARLINDPLTGFTYLMEKEETVTTTTSKSNNHVYSRKELEDIANNINANIRRSNGKHYNVTVNDIIKCVNPETRKKEEEALKDPKAVNKEARKYILDNTKSYQWIDGKVMSNIISKDKVTSTRKDDTVASPKTYNPVDLPRIQVREAEIKKLNGMLPFTIECSFRIKDKRGNINNEVRYLIGIKTVLHLISAKDLTDELREIVTGNIKSLRKVKFKSGEITWKDYIFNINTLKADAAKNVKQNKRWINSLKRLSEYNKTYGSYLKRPIQALTGGNVPIPNATMVITSTDVITLKENTGIDLNDISNVKRLAKNLFLIAFAIVDASAGSMKVLFPDSSDSWDVQSLASIDAEVAKTDNSNLMKELNKMVNR